MLENNIHPEANQQEKRKEEAFEAYQKYLHESQSKVSVSRLKLEPTLAELNTIAGDDIFEIVKVSVSGDARTFYKIGVKEQVFSHIKKVA